MSDRHEKWTPVEPGTVIPAGQPMRHEWDIDGRTHARESVCVTDQKVWPQHTMFVDSSWKPPLVLPTEPTWGIAVRETCGVNGRKTEFKVSEWRLNNNAFICDGWSLPPSYIADFIPLTPEQVARIEAAR